jgi:hypothetical protein
MKSLHQLVYRVRVPASLLACAGFAFAQSPGIPVVKEGHGPPAETLEAAKKLRDDGKLLAMGLVTEQLKRTNCDLILPKPGSRKLAGPEIWERARKAHWRVGFYYLCPRCDNWHLNLAGGYAISASGAIATCYHVAEPKDMREGYLIAATDSGTVMPVLEVLAADKFTDTAIVRIAPGEQFAPLPLNTNVRPGEEVYCYSDPAGHPAYFSRGIVNRFYQHWHGENAKEKFPQRLNVSTDWAPGSSGSAVLDEFGNAIGHVSEISAHGNTPPAGAKDSKTGASNTYIVFHNAVRAADVLALVRPVKK